MLRVIGDTKHPVKIWASELEASAEQQLRNVANLPFIHKHVAVMPDAHAGKGSTVGTVIATKGAIIPAAVGVDIGCGMCAVRLPFKADDIKDLPGLRAAIEKDVPTGMKVNTKVTFSAGYAFGFLGRFSRTAAEHLEPGAADRAAHALGSLGGGNHFIEICADTEGTAWIMLHSGSRGIGNKLATIHINKAKDIMKQYFLMGDKGSQGFATLPDPDLAFLVQDTNEFKDYLHDLMWAQQFAMANRKEMLSRVEFTLLKHMNLLDEHFLKATAFFRVNCHHNYTAIENHFGQNVYVTRKGAVSARDGEWGIIPGSMGTKSYIVQGKGNLDSFCSCSHGAGRRMSRTKAREVFTVEDLKKQTEGVECLKTSDIIDEIPSSYKDIDEVMANQSDLVTPVYQLKQILCVKGAD